jgi:hypothetical protein
MDNNQVEIINCLNGFKREFSDTVSKSIDLSPVANLLTENHLQTMINNERIVDKVVESNGKKINDIERYLVLVEHMLTKLNKQDEKANCPNQKGRSGENKIFELLENSLPSREYSVIDCSKKDHSCDILIKRTVGGKDYPDIRLECKNYSSNVKTSEVTKFERDLEENNDHGIFISLASGICGKKNFEIKKISGNKYAIYLSHFLDNISSDKIHEFCNIIYMLSESTESTTTSDSIEISNELLESICDYISSMSKSVEDAQRNMRSAMDSLSKIDLSLIEKLIRGHTMNKIEKRLIG